MKTSIINIGDELLNGKVLNTNSLDIGQMLYKYGHTIESSLTVSDDVDNIINALKSLVPSNDMIIITGGLGPTTDDITRFAIAKYLGVQGRYSPTAGKWIQTYLDKKNQPVADSQKIQTWIPKGCKVLQNKIGTACGFTFQKEKTRIFIFPGVPGELNEMLKDYIVPIILKKSYLLERHVWIWGWSESLQRAAFKSLNIPDSYRLSSLPSEKGTLLGFSISLPTKNARTKKLEQEKFKSHWNSIVNQIPEHVIVDHTGKDLPETIVTYLSKRSSTLSTAESCTGGGIGFLITSVPGSSSIFKQGYITYSNTAKTNVLNVKENTLKKYGAVSEQVIYEMINGCIKASGADFACAISGIAGPGGGTKLKPVGTIWIGVGTSHNNIIRKFKFRGERHEIRWRSAYAALNLLREFLKNK
jgi:nicotinamide-nucleotide amidase